MATLYQTYRPSNFAEVVNQNHVKITLQSELASGDVAHAYLFSGPRGTGKTTMARVFAKALNCAKRPAGTSEPCGVCLSCEQIKRGSSLDIVEIDAASHTGVDNIRENIIANARIAASGSHYKVFVIDEVHMLSASAFNALLKTLEEPPQKVVFILATTEAHKLPATIISRCQRFDFKRIALPDIVQKLEYIAQKEKITVAREVLESIARHSDGHMRDAESLLGQVFSVGEQSITTEHADLVIPRSNIMAVADCLVLIESKDTAGAIRLVNQLVDEGVDMRQFTAELIESARRMLLAKIHPSLAERFARDFGQAVEEKLAPVIQSTAVERLADIVRACTQASGELKTAQIVQLPLELAVIKLTRLPAEEPADVAGFRPQAADASSVRLADGAVPAGNVPLQTVQDKWSEVLVAIKKHNHSLSFILRACELRDDNGRLCLAFKYKFHQERVMQASIKEILQNVFVEVYGQPLIFGTVLDENMILAAQHLPPEETPPPVEVNDTPADIAPPETSTPAGEQPASPPPDVDAILKMFGGKVLQ